MSRNHRALDRRRWSAVRLAVFTRDNYRCVRCGRAGRLECHHRKPLEAGGAAWDPANLETLCRRCHFAATEAARVSKLPAEVRAWRQYINRVS